MIDGWSLLLVFIAGLITALATGLGAIPFFFFSDVSSRWTVRLWGVASGIMLVASLFGLIAEGLVAGTWFEVGIGVIIGCLLVVVSSHFLNESTIHPKQFEAADFKKLLLILGVLTVHSFPEGVAIGVSFAELNLASGVNWLGFTIPTLAVFMTLAISIHNIPEGVAVSIPLRNLGVDNWKLVGWSIFTSLPQPIGAVIAFIFVRYAREALPIGFGFAAGAMIYLVITEFVPDALEEGKDLSRSGVLEFFQGIFAGTILMGLFFL